jgi:peroxin-7
MSGALLSASYDMTVRNWADGTLDSEVGALRPGEVARGQVVNQYNGHTEFVTGIDWCLFGDVGWMASTAWDQYVRIYDIRAFPVQRSGLP